MVLPTREDAQFLSDAVQGDGDPLSVLQEFANSPRPTPEELKTFEYEVLQDLAMSMMYIVGECVIRTWCLQGPRRTRRRWNNLNPQAASPMCTCVA